MHSSKSPVIKCLDKSGILKKLENDGIFISPKNSRRKNSQNPEVSSNPAIFQTNSNENTQNSLFLPTNPCSNFYNNCHPVGTIKCQPLEGDNFTCVCKDNYTGATCNVEKINSQLLNSQKSEKKQKEILQIFKPESQDNFNNYDSDNDLFNNFEKAVTQNSQIELRRKHQTLCANDAECNSIGICIDGLCNCNNTGFSGNHCETDINECETGQHQCGLKIHCKNTLGSYRCECSSGYELSDSGQCVDINECNELGRCDLNQARCVNTPGSFICQCTKTGFQSVLIGDKFNCENINECSENNGGCDQICIDTQGSYACNCETGYNLGPDDHTCENIDECSVNNGGCRNKCLDTPGSYRCECDPGWMLSADGVSCVDVNECTNGAEITCDLETSKCVNTEGSYTCECQTNYLKDPRTGACHATDQCKFHLHRCVEPAYCVTTTPGNYKCNCPAGYVLSGRYRCADINECLEDLGFMSFGSKSKSSLDSANKPPICGKGYCKNTKPGYTCDCFNLYEGKNCERCKCLNGTCPKDEMSDQCNCFEGWENKLCDTDIDECQINNGGCSHTCQNLPGSYKCTCPVGFDLMRDRKTCQDIDECQVNPNICKFGICKNTIGSYTCECKPGYTMSDTVDNLCVDVNECKLPAVNNCQQNCANTEGGFMCSCNKGYQLNSDAKTCSDINECRLMNNPNNKKRTCILKHTVSCENTEGSFIGGGLGSWD